MWSSGADFTLSRHVAPTKTGFTDAAITEVLLFSPGSGLKQCWLSHQRWKKSRALFLDVSIRMRLGLENG